MVQHIKILRDFIAGLQYRITVKSVANDVGANTSTLSVCNTLWLNSCHFVTIAGTKYKILSFSINSELVLKPVTGTTLVDEATTFFDLPAPTVYSGTPKAVSIEKSTDDFNGPYVWILEVLTIDPPENRDSSAVRSTMRGVNIFCLDSIKEEDWNVIDHYNEVIYPEQNLLDFIVKAMQKTTWIFGETDPPRKIAHADFGRYIVDRGYENTILTERLSGMQGVLDIPFIIEPCDDCEDPIVVCKPVDVSLNGTAFGPFKAGLSVDIPVLDEDDNPKGFKQTVEGQDIWRVIIGGGANKIYYNRPALGGGISYADYDEHWLFANGIDDLVEIDGILQQTDETVSRDYLLYYNAFGHKFRFTGLTGGYYDFNDGQYKDVNGNLSTFNAEFSTPVGASGVDGYIIDHLTGLGYRSIRGGSGGIDWLDTLNVWGTSLFGFNDFMAFPSSWMQTLFNENVANATAQAERPPFQYDQSQFWTATGIEGYLVTAAKVVTYLAQTVTIRNKTTAGINREFNRIHYTRSEFVVQP